MGETIVTKLKEIAKKLLAIESHVKKERKSIERIITQTEKKDHQSYLKSHE